ncbi:MAG: putative lipoprotein [Gammaproteobacteria bacterium]|nr:putative lipoprotein [Gammaproteobacteria bacterium]
MKFPIKVPLLALLVSISACASRPPTPVAADSQVYARRIITEKVDEAVQAQRELAAATKEGQAALVRKQAALTVDEVDVDYIGQPQPLLEAIAYRYGYRYVESGKRTELATVNLRVRKERVPDLLQDLARQIAGGADVVVDHNTKVLRLLYKRV